MSDRLSITAATPADIPLMLELIRALADYEKMPERAVATAADLEAALFGRQPSAEALIARCDGEAAGFALFFHNFSTWLGRHGLYLEDLFVKPQFRGRAIGKALLSHLAAVAVARGCGRFDWQVLDWNQPARDFYESLGAEALTPWVNYRLTGEPLVRLAAGSVTAAAAGSARRDS